MNISNHLNLINNHGFEKWKIGIVQCDAGMSWTKGDICIFKPYDIPEYGMALSEDIERAKTHCAIEFPMTPEQIAENMAEGNLIKSYRCCVGVPLNMIEEIKI